MLKQEGSGGRACTRVSRSIYDMAKDMIAKREVKRRLKHIEAWTETAICNKP
jgi:hypothetical protein